MYHFWQWHCVIEIIGYLWRQWVWEVHCVRSLSVYRCWSCNWCLAPDLKWRHSDRLVRDCVCCCVVILWIWWNDSCIYCMEFCIILTPAGLHDIFVCLNTSACLYLRTCDSVWTQVGVDGLLNGYVASRGGGGCGLNQEARDGFCLGAPRQSDGRVVHVGDAYAARRADILKKMREGKVRVRRNNTRSKYIFLNNKRGIWHNTWTICDMVL